MVPVVEVEFTDIISLPQRFLFGLQLKTRRFDNEVVLSAQ